MRLSQFTGLNVDTLARSCRKTWRGVRRIACDCRAAGDRPSKKDPTLKADLLRAVEPETAGSPTGDSTKWVRRSLRKLARQLAQRACPNVLRRLLRTAGYGLRANHKRLSGQSPPDRDRQFRYFSGRLRHLALSKGCPVLSIDTKNMELVGNFANDGATWCAAAAAVNAHDFPQDAECRAVPYGMYDVGRNRGHVCVGRSADTSQFAVNSLRNWWQTAQAVYTGCRHLLLLADGGGSNSSRGRLRKRELQEFATETGLTITVCHYPPGTSKWNWIEEMMRPPKVAFLAPREESRTRNDTVSRVSGSLVTRLTSRGARKATFGGHVRNGIGSNIGGSASSL